jgi:hypothetical protein
LTGDLRYYPGIGGWRRDHTSASQTMVIAAASSSRATRRLVGSGRRQQCRYSLVLSVVVLHVRQGNARSAWRR